MKEKRKLLTPEQRTANRVKGQKLSRKKRQQDSATKQRLVKEAQEALTVFIATHNPSKETVKSLYSQLFTTQDVRPSYASEAVEKFKLAIAQLKSNVATA